MNQSCQVFQPGRGYEDYRENLLKKMPNVEIYYDSELTASQILEFGFAHVFIATGSTWRKDGKGRSLRGGIKGLENVKVYTPDDVMTADIQDDEILIYDDDQVYLGRRSGPAFTKQG